MYCSTYLTRSLGSNEFLDCPSLPQTIFNVPEMLFSRPPKLLKRAIMCEPGYAVKTTPTRPSTTPDVSIALITILTDWVFLETWGRQRLEGVISWRL